MKEPHVHRPNDEPPILILQQDWVLMRDHLTRGHGIDTPSHDTVTLNKLHTGSHWQEGRRVYQ